MEFDLKKITTDSIDNSKSDNRNRQDQGSCEQVNLNVDRKRLWLGKIESIDSKTMNDSMPISLNHFKKVEI